MQITIDHLTAGAARARGVVVVIDVFRAYTFECFAYWRGINRIYPVAGLDNAYAYKRSHPEYLLAGEREGKKAEGFDFGNSPSEIETLDLTGRTLIHTTSAGTQGIEAAVHADRILTAALVNARATVRYIRRLAPERVSFVCMGFQNERETLEDLVCAEYMRALLLGEPYDPSEWEPQLRKGPGARFFIPEHQSFAPMRDYYLSLETDRFPFALEIAFDEEGARYTQKIDI